MNGPRNLILAAAAALLLGGAGGAALAHPLPEGEEGGKKVERIVVIRDGAGGDHKGARHRVRTFDVRSLADCEGGEKIVDETAGDGDKKTKVILCRKGAAISADRSKHLEEALARINAHDELSDEQKERISAALRSAIERSRGAR